MDPLTQGTIGAVLPQSLSKKRSIVWATIVGFLAGMAPDLDIFIRSETDPLLFLEYHRQFTHSLVFIPVGGSVCAGVLHFIIGRARGVPFFQTWLFCLLGYGTHALLDACTTYGTVLLWPFSNERFAWNVISIIDPLFTLPILLAVVLGMLRRRFTYARLGCLWAMVYLTVGIWQHGSAVDMGRSIAIKRGHEPVRLDAKPSFANILVWKTVYESEGRYFVDAVRVGFQPRVFEGESISKLDIERDFSWLDKYSQQYKDVERFRWFSRGYLAKDPEFPDRIIDIRYSLVPNEIRSIWSIQLTRDHQERHVAYLTHRQFVGRSKRRLWEILSD